MMSGESGTCSLTWKQVRAFRLARHGLFERRPSSQLVETVGRVCGVQAQVQSAAELQLWARLDGLSPQAVRRALWEDRTLVKTWCMRGTLHLLAANELPIYVAALRTHDRWWKGAWLRLVECSAEERQSVLEAISETLNGVPLNRQQLADAVTSRVTPEPTSAEEAWQQIVRAYLRAYGPASREEFARWWGMQPATAGRALEASVGDPHSKPGGMTFHRNLYEVC